MNLLDGLVWNYRVEDMEKLVNFKIFELLQEGDGSKFHPLCMIRFESGMVANIYPNEYIDSDCNLGHRVEVSTASHQLYS